MKDHQYIIGSGYHSHLGARGDAMAWFFDELWMPNTEKYSDPYAIYVLATGDGLVPECRCNKHYKQLPLFWVDILGDIGHCGALLNGSKPYHFCGCSASILTMAMIAYLNECDFIYKEQDVLMFGPCVETMYRELGDRGCIFGRQRCMPCANSLMLVRHSYIPEFVRLYLATERENTPDGIAECKYARMQQQHPDQICYYSFGVDRDRPLDLDARAWYAQKFSPEELLAMRAAELVEFDSLPEGIDTFTN